MSSWQIARIADRDLAEVALLHGLCFPGEAWSREDFAGILAIAGASGHWVSEAEDPQRRPQAFLFDTLLGPAGEIVTLGVAPGARRRGAGRALLGDLFVRARGLGIAMLTLEVADDNAAALALYESLGFERLGVRRGYYRRPGGAVMDARLLRRILLPG
ncbi:MAG TPA: GNAT family N-acetyltransferase [Stellaceae bacterium]|nr:GNAT family N-acetyltransferase [Stellaceae bacterium]